MKPTEPHKPIIERAFELARSGAFVKVRDLEKVLYAEGYPKNSHQLVSPTLRKQLLTVCKDAQDNE